MYAGMVGALMMPLLIVWSVLSAGSPPKDVLAVVDIDAPTHLLGMQSQIQRSILAEAAKQKIAVITPEALLEKLGAVKFKALSKCGDQPACAAQLLEGTGATKVVTGKLGLNDKNYLLKLYLLDLGKLTVVTDVDRAVLIASRRLQKDVDGAVPGLLRGEREARGTLVINATVANAQVSINGEFIGASPLTEQLKPGKYEVKVEKKHYLTVTRLVDVDPNQQKAEEFRMLLIPGEKPEEEIVPPVSALAANDTPFRLTAPTYVSGAIGIVAAGVGIAFGLMAKNGEKALLDGYDKTLDRYSGTRANALAAQKNALIADVAFGVAGAALIATVIFAALDATGYWDPKTDVEVVPAVTPGGGGLVFGGRF